jgi:tRNA modification GTPase
VAALISAEEAEDARQSRSVLEGEFSGAIGQVEKELVDLLAQVEAAIDFVDQDLEILSTANARRRLNLVRARLDRLRASCRRTQRGEDRLVLLLYGPSNSGKSSLFNRLVPGADVIMSPALGTTRDILARDVTWGDLKIRLLDGPGELESPDELEGSALALMRRALDRSDGVLWVVDVLSWQRALPGLEHLAARRRVLIYNKVDVGAVPPEACRVLGDGIEVSARTGQGFPALQEGILRRFRPEDRTGASFAVSLRPWNLLEAASEALDRARQALDAEAPLEIVAADLRDALSALGEITGKSVTEEVLSRVFERFCIGK